MISRSLSKNIYSQLQSLVSEKAGIGFQLGLGYRDRPLGVWCVGQADRSRILKMTPETWLDLSSLTKILSTTYFCVWAIQQGVIAGLEEKLSTFFPHLESELKNKSLKQVLEHQAGFKAIWEDLPDLSTRQERERYFISQLDQAYEAGGSVRYSDVGFMAVGIILEQVLGGRLKDLWHSHWGREINLGFGPLSFWTDRFPSIFKLNRRASILSLEDPDEVLRGHVQDPRAEWFFGDAGHAGLFGTASGIELWAQRLFRAYHGKDHVLGEKVLRSFLNFEETSSSYLNGFDRPSRETSQAGRFFPPTTIGHLGYTGCSFWMDMETGFRVSLLSHRFQKGIDSDRLKILRPKLHDWLWQEVFASLHSSSS